MYDSGRYHFALAIIAVIVSFIYALNHCTTNTAAYSATFTRHNSSLQPSKIVQSQHAKEIMLSDVKTNEGVDGAVIEAKYATSRELLSLKKTFETADVSNTLGNQPENPRHISSLENLDSHQNVISDNNIPTEKELLTDSVLFQMFSQDYQIELNSISLYKKLKHSPISSELTEKFIAAIEADLQNDPNYVTALLFVICSSSSICLFEYEHNKENGRLWYNIQKSSIKDQDYKFRLPMGLSTDFYNKINKGKIEYNALIIEYVKS